MKKNRYPIKAEEEYAEQLQDIAKPYELAVTKVSVDVITKDDYDKEVEKLEEAFKSVKVVKNTDEVVVQTMNNVNVFATNDLSDNIAEIALNNLSKNELEALGLSTKTGRPLSKAVELAPKQPIIKQSRMSSPTFKRLFKDNTKLIKDIPKKMQNEVRQILYEKYKGNLTKEQAERMIRNKTKELGENRAKVIARDQVGKMNSIIRQEISTEAGIDSYIWRTQGDDRVRDSHEDFEGQTFTYKEGSPEGHPGEPIMCRCYDEPLEQQVIELCKQSLEEEEE